jgi:O-antigen/teichoic acid export membrane protein
MAYLFQKLADRFPVESPIRRRLLARAFLSKLWTDYMSGDSIHSRIARGAFWCVVGTGISQSLGLAATVICARLLGSAKYGQLGIVLTTVNLFATLATVGLGVTATKHVAEYRRQDPRNAGRIIGMSSMVSGLSGSLIAILLIVLAPWLSRTTLKAPLATELQLGALMMLFAAVNGYQTGTLAGFEAFKTQATLNTIRGLFAFPAIVTGVVLGGLRGAMIGYTVTSAVNFLIHEIAIRRQCRLHSVPISYGVQKADLKLLWSFSIPVLIASFSFTPAVWWTSAKLGTTAGYTQLGIFNAAMQWQNLVMFFSNAVAILGLPTLSAVLPERSIEKYTQMLKINFLLTTTLAAVIAVPVGLAAPWIMSFYGHGFASGTSTLRLICIATVISSMNMSVGDAIWSLGAARAGMLLSLLRGAALVVGASLFRVHGAAGLAGAYVFMAVVQTMVQGPFIYLLLRKQAAVWAVPRPVLEQV